MRALEAAVPTERDGVVGYEVFLIGGDDALVAVPADRFFVFLRAFSRKVPCRMGGVGTPIVLLRSAAGSRQNADCSGVPAGRGVLAIGQTDEELG